MHETGVRLGRRGAGGGAGAGETNTVELRFAEDSTIHIARPGPGAALVATVQSDDRRYGVKLTFDGGLVECVTGQSELYDLIWGPCPEAA